MAKETARIDVARLANDLGVIARRLERTDLVAAKSLQLIILRLNEKLYETAAPIGDVIDDVLEEVTRKSRRTRPQPRP